MQTYAQIGNDQSASWLRKAAAVRHDAIRTPPPAPRIPAPGSVQAPAEAEGARAGTVDVLNRTLSVQRNVLCFEIKCL